MYTDKDLKKRSNEYINTCSNVKSVQYSKVTDVNDEYIKNLSVN